MSIQRHRTYARLLIDLTPSHLPCTGYPFDSDQAILNKENLTHKSYQNHFDTSLAHIILHSITHPVALGLLNPIMLACHQCRAFIGVDVFPNLLYAGL
jgi:hypothetical protein